VPGVQGWPDSAFEEVGPPRKPDLASLPDSGYAGGSDRADELSADELRAGADRLARKLRRCRPRFVAFLGGLNAHFQIAGLARLFAELRTVAGLT
jgi:hypothetical protein